MMIVKLDPDALVDTREALSVGLDLAVRDERVDHADARTAQLTLLVALAADPSFADQLEDALVRDNARRGAAAPGGLTRTTTPAGD